LVDGGTFLSLPCVVGVVEWRIRTYHQSGNSRILKVVRCPIELLEPIWPKSLIHPHCIQQFPTQFPQEMLFEKGTLRLPTDAAPGEGIEPGVGGRQ